MADTTPRRGVPLPPGTPGPAAPVPVGSTARPRQDSPATPRRSATSPSAWQDWDDGDDLPVVPTRSARLVDSVPPPMPAMPRRSGPTPVSQVSAAGRRYAPSSLPEDHVRAEPRRSATSPSQWEKWQECDEPASYRVRKPRAEQEPVAPAGEPEAPTRRTAWFWLLVGLLVLALVVGGVLLGMSLGDHESASAAQPVEPSMIATPDDAGQIGGTWHEDATENPISGTSPAALCLSAQPTDQVPGAEHAGLRRLASGSGLTMTHQLNVYDTPKTSKQAYAALQRQLGGCSGGTVAHLDGAWSMWGLSDEAIIVRATQQEKQPLVHSMVLVRVGSAVNVFDVMTPSDPPEATTLLALLQPLVVRQCKTYGGSCATDTTPSDMPVPSGDVEGFLAPADVPRITPGVGRWAAGAPQKEITTRGTGCEGVPLGEIPGVQSHAQRTLGLSGDPKAPTTFGVDEVVLTTANHDAATKVGRLLVQNIARCGSSTKTGRILGRDRIPSTQGYRTPISGTSFQVSQSAGSGAIPYQVVVMTVDKHVVYLLLTPATDYTMAKPDWLALVTRAGERALQLPS